MALMPPLSESPAKLYLGLALIIPAFVIFVALKPFTVIGAGERGVVLHWGAFQGRVMEPGLKWKTPISQSVIKMDVQTQKEEIDVSAASKDLQTVTARIAINFHPDPAKVGELYVNVGTSYQDRIIAPSIQEAVKAATAKYTAEELITKRELVKGDAQALLVARLAPSNIIIENLSIVNFDFSASFNAAIESKVTAEQEALKAKNNLEQVKFEAQQQIETAKAEAESIKIQAQAINAQGGADYVKLQAIAKWDGVLPAQMIPNATVPFIELNK